MRNRYLSTNRQIGFTLLELLIVGAVLSVMVALSSYYAVREANKQTASKQAQILDDLRKAVETYMQTNADAILLNTPIPVDAANPGAGIAYADPRQPTIAELVARRQVDGQLTAGATLFGGGQYRVAINLVDNPGGCAANVPPNCDLAARIWIDQPLRRGGNVSPDAASRVAAAFGPNAGWSGAPSPTGAAQPGRIAWMDGTGATEANPLGNVAGVVMVRAGFGSSGFAQYVRQNDTRPIRLRNSLTVGPDAATEVQIGGGAVDASAALRSAGTLAVTGDSTLTGQVRAMGNVRVSGQADIDGQLSAVNGRVRATADATGGGLLSSGTVAVNTTASAASSCGGYSSGAIAKDALGKLVQCQVSGTWAPVSASMQGRYVYSGGYCCGPTQQFYNDGGSDIVVTARPNDGGKGMALAVDGMSIAASNSSTAASATVPVGSTLTIETSGAQSHSSVAYAVWQMDGSARLPSFIANQVRSASYSNCETSAGVYAPQNSLRLYDNNEVRWYRLTGTVSQNLCNTGIINHYASTRATNGSAIYTANYWDGRTTSTPQACTAYDVVRVEHDGTFCNSGSEGN